MPSLNKRLRKACRSGNYEEFRSLFEVVNIDLISEDLAHCVVSIPEQEDKCEGECKYSSRIRILKNFIERGFDVNQHVDDTVTPLHVAAECGFVCAIKLLIENGVSVDVCTPSGVTPLMLACMRERYSAMKVLLEYGANVALTYLPYLSCSAIHYAAASGNVHIMRLLLKYGGLVNASLRNFNYYVPHSRDTSDEDENENMSITPLHLASQKMNVEMVKCLLEAGATATLQHHNGLYDIHYMACVEDSEVIRLLVDKGASVNAESAALITPLFWACQHGKYENVVLLLELGADPSQRDMNKDLPLAYAVKGGNIEIVKLFLKLGYKLEKFEDETIMAGKCSPTSIAAFYGYKELFMLCQEQGFSVDYTETDGSMPIHFAARQGSLEMCEYILSLGIDIDCKNNELKTPLHLAAREGHPSLCKYLIEKGADTRVVDINGRTVLHAAVESSKPNTVEIILNFDPNIINITDKYGETPFILSNSFFCISRSPLIKYHTYSKSCGVLLKNGANPNNRRRDGSVPIQDYILFDNDISTTLLNYGSNITFTSNQRKSALDDAIEQLAEELEEDSPMLIQEYDYSSTDNSEEDHDVKDDNYIFKGAELIVSHANKLRAANMGCSDRTVESLKFSHKHYYDKCIKEIAAMKQIALADNISLYSFLVDSVERCLRTPGTEEVLMKLNPFKEFPIYSSMLVGKLERAAYMKHLLEVGIEFFNLLSENKPMLSYDCIQNILSFLDIPNLLALEKVINPDKITYMNSALHQ